MAANFWTSKHACWLLSKDKQHESHAKDKLRGFSGDQLQQLTSFHIQYIQDLTKAGHQAGLRQRVAATACVFFHRFYAAGNDFCTVDPRTLAPAALYLAAKVEETQLQAKLLFHLVKKVADKHPTFPSLTVKILMDLEMALLEALDFQLVVWHPYSDLAAFLRDAEAPEQLCKSAWSLINDSYHTDCCLSYPPHMIALACMTLAAAVTQTSLQTWMEGLQDLDLKQVYTVANDLMQLYEKISVITCSRDTESLFALLK